MTPFYQRISRIILFAFQKVAHPVGRPNRHILDILLACRHTFLGYTTDCDITRKYRSSAHRDCNVNVKSNHKILIVFHNLKIYDFHVIIQELAKFQLIINIIPNVLEKIYEL